MAKHRLQFDLEEAAFKKFEKLRKLSGARTNAAVFQQALTVYEWFIRQRAEGKRIQLVDGDNVINVELLIP